MELDPKPFTDLPEDLSFKILEKLNCEELVPLSAVCKLWNKYLKRKAFTSNHKNKDDITSTRLILSQLGCEKQKITTKIYILDLLKMMIFSVRLPYTTPMELFVNFIGSENGFMCIRRAFSSLKHVLTIFNPVTLDFVDIEDYVNHVPHDHALHAFGYNKYAESFEIMLLYINPVDHKRIWWTKYILKTLTWIDAQPSSIDKEFISGETLSLDDYYVWTYEVNGPPFQHVEYLIIFEKCGSEFGEMKIPDDIININYKLVLHHNKFGILFYIMIFDGPYTIELWTCDVATRNENSWMPMYTLYNFSSFFEPICLIDDFTMLTTGAAPDPDDKNRAKRNDIFTYNITQQQWHRADNMKDPRFL